MLLCSSTVTNPRSLVWDEQNLIENETHRTATMKIDEPKTPFNRDYMYHEDHEGTSNY